MAPYFASMAGATARAWGADLPAPAQSASFTAAGCEVFVDLAGHIDIGAEIARNEKEADQLGRQIDSKEKKLANENFVSRARPTWCKRSATASRRFAGGCKWCWPSWPT